MAEIPIIGGRQLSEQNRALVSEYVRLIARGQEATEYMRQLTTNQVQDHIRAMAEEELKPNGVYMALKEVEQAVHNAAQLGVMQTYALLAALGADVPVPQIAVREEGDNAEQ